MGGNVGGKVFTYSYKGARDKPFTDTLMSEIFAERKFRDFREFALKSRNLIPAKKIFLSIREIKFPWKYFLVHENEFCVICN